ncbi:hypothetical protein ABPG72_011512, partial [Tetrahymena utriculariae]
MIQKNYQKVLLSLIHVLNQKYAFLKVNMNKMKNHIYILLQKKCINLSTLILWL